MSSHPHRQAKTSEDGNQEPVPTTRVYSPIFISHEDFLSHLTPETRKKLAIQLEKEDLTISQEALFRQSSENAGEHAENPSSDETLSPFIDANFQSLISPEQTDEHRASSTNNSTEKVLSSEINPVNSVTPQQQSDTDFEGPYWPDFKKEDHSAQYDDEPPSELLVEIELEAGDLPPVRFCFFQPAGHSIEETLAAVTPNFNPAFLHNDMDPLGRATSDLRLLDLQNKNETSKDHGRNPSTQLPSSMTSDQPKSIIDNATKELMMPKLDKSGNSSHENVPEEDSKIMQAIKATELAGKRRELERQMQDLEDARNMQEAKQASIDAVTHQAIMERIEHLKKISTPSQLRAELDPIASWPGRIVKRSYRIPPPGEHSDNTAGSSNESIQKGAFKPFGSSSSGVYPGRAMEIPPALPNTASPYSARQHYTSSNSSFLGAPFNYDDKTNKAEQASVNDPQNQQSRYPYSTYRDASTQTIPNSFEDFQDMLRIMRLPERSLKDLHVIHYLAFWETAVRRNGVQDTYLPRLQAVLPHFADRIGITTEELRFKIDTAAEDQAKSPIMSAETMAKSRERARIQIEAWNRERGFATGPPIAGPSGSAIAPTTASASASSSLSAPKHQPGTIPYSTIPPPYKSELFTRDEDAETCYLPPKRSRTRRSRTKREPLELHLQLPTFLRREKEKRDAAIAALAKRELDARNEAKSRAGNEAKAKGKGKTTEVEETGEEKASRRNEQWK